MTPLERSTRHLILAWTFVATAIAFAASPTQPAISAFRANPEPVLAGTASTYAWTLTGTTESIACSLDPGDGTPTITIANCANDATPHHTYNTAGTYTATLNLPTAGLQASTKVTVVNGRPTNAKAGTLIWKYKTGAFIASSPALAPDGTVYFGSADRHIYALNPNGTLKWKVPTRKGIQRESGWVWAAPSIAANGTIYVPVSLDGLYAINPEGTLKWRDPTNDWLHRSVAIANNGTIYMTNLHHLDAYQPDGQLAWRHLTVDGGFYETACAPAIAPDGTIYVGSEDSYIYAINPDGTLKWRYRTGDRILSSPAIGKDGTIYEGSIDGALYALSPDGTFRWKFQTGLRFQSSAAIGPDGTIYAANDAGILYAINPNGTQKWQHSIEDTHYRIPIPHQIVGGPTVANDGTIYMGSDDGTLYAINPDGTLAWTFHTGKYIETAPAIAPDGTLYLASDDGTLYALHVNATGLAQSPWPKFLQGNRNTGRAP